METASSGPGLLRPAWSATEDAALAERYRADEPCAVMNSRPGPVRFSAEEDAVIVARYATALLKDIAAQLGRPSRSVAARSLTLARRGELDARKRRYQPRWTLADEDTLREIWGCLSDRAVARRLGRTATACELRAKRLGISRRMAFYSARNVAAIFGVDPHVVVRWIRAKLLIGKQSVVRAGQRSRCWAIQDEAIEAFIRSYPWHYDPKRVEARSYWRALAERVHRADPWLSAAEAASELGTHAQTLHRHIQRGWLPAERTRGSGGRGEYRIRRSALAGFRRWPRPRAAGRSVGRASLRAAGPVFAEVEVTS